MPVLGPLDRRTVRTRCVACARRKIKCAGGPPTCLYCAKKGQNCVPQAANPTRGEGFFVNVSLPASALVQASSKMKYPAPNLCSNVPLDKSSLFVRHFFSVFLVMNDFGSELDLDSVVAHFQKSSSLYYAAVAVGALDLGRKALLASAVETKDARVGALAAYCTSVGDLHRDLGRRVPPNHASLWTTLFLGLFELMHDDTGEGFVKHFLFGTSRILQIRGPDAHRYGPGRSFFLTVRVFEICRALIYSEPTFLAQDEWRLLTERMWPEELCGGWHPKEALFDLMISCSSLSDLVWNVLRPESKFPIAIVNDKLHELAVKGHIIRESLNKWFTNFQKWSSETCTPDENTQSMLATIYFHATSIFISGIFDYRPEFLHINTPSLPQRQIQKHVDSILSNTQIALQTTNLGGVLFFFPLRVAGARVMTNEEAAAIIGALDEISKRSFIIASIFTIDLRELWLLKGISGI